MKQFKRLNNLFGWLAFFIAAVTYCLTVEPSASFWDCPEFILSGNKLEVGHPPGAPFFMLTANFFSLFAEPAQVAYMVNIMSALLSAGGILFLFWSITHLTRKLIVGKSEIITGAQTVTILASGMVGALAYTWSDTYWFSAVEGEVYGYSSLFTAVVFWLILKWEDSDDSPRSDRWLILIAYLVGLSIGVHLLNLLCIPAIVLVAYFKKHPDANFKGILLALIVSAVLVAIVLYGIVPGVVKVGGWFELLFVNVLGMPYNSGVVVYLLLLFGTLITGIIFSAKGRKQSTIAWVFTLSVALLGIPFYGNSLLMSLLIGAVVLYAVYKIATYYADSAKKFLISLRAFNTIFLCMLMIMVGYASYALIVIRSSANTPMDQNSPEDIFTLGSYLNREQYGTRPLFYGQHFASKVKFEENGEPAQDEGAPTYIKTEDGEYERLKDENGKVEKNGDYKYEQNMFFPRMYSSQHIGQYYNWIGRKAYKSGRSPKAPTQGENIKFFISYQVNHMYWRYFMWNFVGRQNDIQNRDGESENGNWISGIPAVDNARLGDQELLPAEKKENKGRNVFFALPLLLGILGIVWQLRRGKEGKQQFWIVFMLFFMTGLAIVLYLNQTPMQPRERDYAYAGSFYAFAIWIGMGVAAITHFITRKFKDGEEKKKLLVGSVVGAVCLLVPIQMVSQTWDDHDRSGRYACRDFGLNYLNTLPDEGFPIIFTCGDNDTFPLWYNQEVEGERTDVRVCNLSYLSADWYIDQMRSPAYESPSLPISWERGDYIGNTNHVIYILPKEAEEYINAYLKANPEKAELIGDIHDVRNVSKVWIQEANDKNPSANRKAVQEILGMLQEIYGKDSGIGKNSAIIPSHELRIPVDYAAVGRSGMKVPESVEHGTQSAEYMVLDLSKRSALRRHEFLMLEMIANANWERPLYIATTVGEDNYLSELKPFLVLEGLAYRITPFDWGKYGRYGFNYSGRDFGQIAMMCLEEKEGGKFGLSKEKIKDLSADEILHFSSVFGDDRMGKKEQMELVINTLEAAVKYYPEDYRIYNNLGVMFCYYGDSIRSDSCFAKAAALDSRAFAPQQNLGMLRKGSLGNLIVENDRLEKRQPIDVEKFYNNLMTRFKWGGIKEYPGYYADEQIRNMIIRHRYCFLELAEEMLENMLEKGRVHVRQQNRVTGDIELAMASSVHTLSHENMIASGNADMVEVAGTADKIVRLLDKCFEELPDEVCGYDVFTSTRIIMLYNSILQIQKLYKDCLGKDVVERIRERALALADENMQKCKEQLVWLKSQGKKENEGMATIYKSYHERNVLLKMLMTDK